MATTMKIATAAVIMLMVTEVLVEPSQIAKKRLIPQFYTLKRFGLSEGLLHNGPKEPGKNGELKLASLGRQKSRLTEGFSNGRVPFPPMLQKSYVPVMHSDVDYSTSSDQVTDDYEIRERRKFPEVDSRGFDEDIFDEGFGEWQPMKRW